ncbi:hypothetical protein [Hyphomonas sp.]|uniref:hypothetical protein n=1 Tax=Hyphomonas sp. TaxID=87 RepID=UPI0025C49026|nr:hypothetical protein [Hyphomonas sp.]
MPPATPRPAPLERLNRWLTLGGKGTPMMEVVDESFLADYLDKLKLSASEQRTPDPEMPQ